LLQAKSETETDWEKMMRRILAVTAIALLSVASPASAKEKITYSHLIDPVVEAFLYPIKSGKIKSEMIDVEFFPQSVPAAIQATATKQFDVVMTAAMAVPNAAERGLQLRMLSVGTLYPENSRGGDVWVQANSPYKSIEDLKGKTISVSSYESTGTTWIRLALWKKYNVNVRYEGGDFQWVEIPAGSQPGALSAGRVEASTLIHSQALMALGSKDFRSIANTAKDNFDLYGVPSVAAVNVAYPERLAAKPELYKEFNRMLKASRDYALANIDEVSEAVHKKTGAPVSFIKDWTGEIGDFPAVMSDVHIKSVDTLWKAAKDLGILKGYPEAKTMVWDQALKQ
jgi:NitT/TauT family transport system substrate-binding protein